MHITCDQLINALEINKTVNKTVKYLKIGKKLFYNLCKEYNVDYSKYNDILFNPDINLIKQYAKTENATDIGKIFNVSRGTIVTYCKKNNIEILNNRRKNKFKCTSDELNKFLDNGLTYSQIANELGVKKATLMTYINRNSIDVNKKKSIKININEDILNFINKLVIYNYSVKDISTLLNVDIYCVKRLIKENNILIKNNISIMSSKYKSDFIKYCENNNIDKVDDEFIKINSNIADEADIIRRKLTEINKNFIFKKEPLYDYNDFIIENISKLSFKDMALNIGCPTRAVIDYCIRNKIYKSLFFDSKIIQYPDDSNFLNNIFDISLSCSDIAYMYNVSNSVDNRWRNELAGKDFRVKNDSIYRMTLPERKIANVLIELDIVYFYEYKIGKYKIDFYLGKKRIIEVQGDYWHSKPKSIELDNIKNKYYKDNGFKILYLTESEINNNIDSVKQEINFFIGSL